jgi:hypothetical protein
MGQGHNERTIHLLLTEHGIDATKTTHIQCPEGVLVVEMLPGSKKIGSLFIPDEVADKYRPDIGIVISAGPGVSVERGTMVAVRPYDGTWIRGFECGSYKTTNQVRIYGKATPFKGEIQRIDWFESVPLIVEVDEVTEEAYVRAIDHNLVIRREPAIAEELGFLLPDASQYWTGFATIESVGGMVDYMPVEGGPLQVGDRIHYDQRAVIEFAFSGDKLLCFLPDIGVNFRHSPEEEDCQDISPGSPEN